MIKLLIINDMLGYSFFNRKNISNVIDKLINSLNVYSGANCFIYLIFYSYSADLIY